MPIAHEALVAPVGYSRSQYIECTAGRKLEPACLRKDRRCDSTVMMMGGGKCNDDGTGCDGRGVNCDGTDGGDGDVVVDNAAGRC